MSFFFIALFLLGSRFHHVGAQYPNESVIAIGPNGTCAVPIDATISVRPVLYSTYLPGNTEIAPFDDGLTYTIDNAPTLFVVNTIVVTTIYHNGTFEVLPTGSALRTSLSKSTISEALGMDSTLLDVTYQALSTTYYTLGNMPSINQVKATPSPNGNEGNLPSSSALQPTSTPTSSIGNLAISNSIQTISNPGSNIGSLPSSIPAEFNSNPGGDTSSLPLSTSTTLRIQPTSVTVNNAGNGQTGALSPIESSTVLVVPGSSGFSGPPSSIRATAQASTSLPPLSFGDGIPSGTVASLPTQSLIVLGYLDISVSQVDGNGEVVDRRQLNASPLGITYSTEAASVETAIQTAVAAAQATSSAAWINSDFSAPVSCNEATPYTLEGGRLLQNQTAIGKYENDTMVEFGSALDGNANAIIDTEFSFINGVLVWQAPDVGLATFYSCAGVVYASFDPSDPGEAGAPFNDCNQIALGGLSSASCAARIAALAVLSASVSAISPSSGSSSPSPSSPTALSSVVPGLTNSAFATSSAAAVAVSIPFKDSGLSASTSSLRVSSPSSLTSSLQGATYLSSTVAGSLLPTLGLPSSTSIGSQLLATSPVSLQLGAYQSSSQSSNSYLSSNSFGLLQSNDAGVGLTASVLSAQVQSTTTSMTFSSVQLIMLSGSFTTSILSNQPHQSSSTFIYSGKLSLTPMPSGSTTPSQFPVSSTLSSQQEQLSSISSILVLSMAAQSSLPVTSSAFGQIPASVSVASPSAFNQSPGSLTEASILEQPSSTTASTASRPVASSLSGSSTSTERLSGPGAASVSTSTSQSMVYEYPPSVQFSLYSSNTRSSQATPSSNTSPASTISGQSTPSIPIPLSLSLSSQLFAPSFPLSLSSQSSAQVLAASSSSVPSTLSVGGIVSPSETSILSNPALASLSATTSVGSSLRGQSPPSTGSSSPFTSNSLPSDSSGSLSTFNYGPPSFSNSGTLSSPSIGVMSLSGFGALSSSTFGSLPIATTSMPSSATTDLPSLPSIFGHPSSTSTCVSAGLSSITTPISSLPTTSLSVNSVTTPNLSSAPLGSISMILLSTSLSLSPVSLPGLSTILPSLSLTMVASTTSVPASTLGFASSSVNVLSSTLSISSVSAIAPSGTFSAALSSSFSPTILTISAKTSCSPGFQLGVGNLATVCVQVGMNLSTSPTGASSGSSSTLSVSSVTYTTAPNSSCPTGFQLGVGNLATVCVQIGYNLPVGQTSVPSSFSSTSSLPSLSSSMTYSTSNADVSNGGCSAGFQLGVGNLATVCVQIGNNQPAGLTSTPPTTSFTLSSTNSSLATTYSTTRTGAPNGACPAGFQIGIENLATVCIQISNSMPSAFITMSGSPSSTFSSLGLTNLLISSTSPSALGSSSTFIATTVSTLAGGNCPLGFQLGVGGLATVCIQIINSNLPSGMTSSSTSSSYTSSNPSLSASTFSVSSSSVSASGVSSFTTTTSSLLSSTSTTSSSASVITPVNGVCPTGFQLAVVNFINVCIQLPNLVGGSMTSGSSSTAVISPIVSSMTIPSISSLNSGPSSTSMSTLASSTTSYPTSSITTTISSSVTSNTTLTPFSMTTTATTTISTVSSGCGAGLSLQLLNAAYVCAPICTAPLTLQLLNNIPLCLPICASGQHLQLVAGIYTCL